jgi:hypothetical protein
MPGTSGERAPPCLATKPSAISARRRATFERTAHPTLYVIATIPDLWPRFPPSARSGWPDGLSLPRSSRRNAARGPISSRSRNLRCAPIPRGFVLSFNTRGRRGGFATPAAAATALCCGPRYAVIWHAKAHQLTPFRGPRDEALRDSATPTRGSERRSQAWVELIPNTFLATRPSATAPRRPRSPVVVLVAQASRLHMRPGRPHHKMTRMRLPFVVHASRVQDGKSEIRNPKSEIPQA